MTVKYSNDRMLQGQTIRLEPLEERHREELAELLADRRIWEFTWRKINSREDALDLVDTALANQAAGTEIPFVMIEAASGRIAGTSRLKNVDLKNRSAEIGCTWIGPAYWRTAVNTEAKAWMLKFAFEELDLIRIEFTIVGTNLRSQRAIERIGAIKEGVLRKHRISPDGTVHDNVVYSITDDDWPAVEANLHHLLYVKYARV